MEETKIQFNTIPIGYEWSFEHLITDADIETFAKLTGDTNPLHLDNDFANSTSFNGRVVHGMLAASFFSALVGKYLPLRANLYVKQTLEFKKPIRPNTNVTVSGKIIRIIESMKVIVIRTTISDGKEMFIEGEAWVMGYE